MFFPKKPLYVPDDITLMLSKGLRRAGIRSGSRISDLGWIRIQPYKNPHSEHCQNSGMLSKGWTQSGYRSRSSCSDRFGCKINASEIRIRNTANMP